MTDQAGNPVTETFGEPIYAYTRKQAVEDGQQVKLTGDYAALAREAGWNHPVYLTSGVCDLIDAAMASKEHSNDFIGVLWDILYMARFGKEVSADTRAFKVIITGTRKREHLLYARVGPTDIDDPAPAMTIMLPEER
ncbi:MAG: hypothetical protein P8182_17815 [Deltaproteobacteria bacterium]|jgi:hypothetical protein